MGKLSDIEQLKLKAAFFNNLSVGLFLGGLLIPYLVIVQHAGTIIDRVTSGRPLTFPEVGDTVCSLLAMVLAFHGGRRMRRDAVKTIALIQDDDQPETSNRPTTEKS